MLFSPSGQRPPLPPGSSAHCHQWKPSTNGADASVVTNVVNPPDRSFYVVRTYEQLGAFGGFAFQVQLRAPRLRGAEADRRAARASGPYGAPE